MKEKKNHMTDEQKVKYNYIQLSFQINVNDNRQIVFFYFYDVHRFVNFININKTYFVDLGYFSSN